MSITQMDLHGLWVYPILVHLLRFLFRIQILDTVLGDHHEAKSRNL